MPPSSVPRASASECATSSSRLQWLCDCNRPGASSSIRIRSAPATTPSILTHEVWAPLGGLEGISWCGPKTLNPTHRLLQALLLGGQSEGELAAALQIVSLPMQ